jgi:beta-phosphoglucomutase-like phosphatase (HAD superfamily)
MCNVYNSGAKQCIASGSPKDRVELCVDVAGMRPFFPEGTVYTRELVNLGKPAPDLFLHTAEKMGYSPADCLVVEDSTSGIRAALAAGMEVLGYMGGGHTNTVGYMEAIRKFDIPLVNTEQEVLEYVLSRMQ